MSYQKDVRDPLEREFEELLFGNPVEPVKPTASFAGGATKGVLLAIAAAAIAIGIVAVLGALFFGNGPSGRAPW